jgi:diguanylate cyclase (GGDEF)-like protein/hemerythrin-like metal-binding protein
VNSPAPAGAALADALDAFMAFPGPLALLEPDGRPELVNTRYLDRFGSAGLDTATLRHLAQDPDGRWRDVPLSSQIASAPAVRARAVRTPGRILLIVDEPESETRRDDLDALRARIGELEQLAATDHLTGAWNRAHLDRVIASELARSVSGRQPLSLVLFDIDHFKGINDRLGHAVGDKVLRELARLVRSINRSSDLFFRWGGEEFVVLVSSAGYRHAEIVATKLLRAVAEHRFEDAGAVTVSIGVAEHDGDESPEAWFRRLDEALYEAKRTGRNRIVVARRGSSDAWASEGGPSALHLVWQEGYECGEPTIDAEHRELFRLANGLIDAVLRTPDQPAALRSVLLELLAHVQRHFADEEAILARHQYPQLDEHRRAHAGLLRRGRAMLAGLDTGAANIGAIAEFLAQDVVARHMMVVDRAFFPLFRDRPTALPPASPRPA